MEKLGITPIGQDNEPLDAERIIVQFNPTSYTVGKSVTWKPLKKFGFRDAPQLEYSTSGSRSLKLELFFDVTEPVDPSNPGGLVDVRQLTGQLVALTRRSSKGETKKGRPTLSPPFIRIDWGGAGPKNSDFPFIGAVDNLSQTFTLFSPEGRPLRATVSLGVTESSDPRQDKLLEGDFEKAVKAEAKARLYDLAQKYSGQSADWRKIAEANKIDNPLNLPTGSYLKLPSNDKSGKT